MEGSASCFSDTSIANHSHESVNQIFILKLFCKQALFYVLTTYKNILSHFQRDIDSITRCGIY